MTKEGSADPDQHLCVCERECVCVCVSEELVMLAVPL